MKQPVKSVLLKYYHAISALALHPLFVSHMCDMPFGRKALYVSVRFVLHEALGLFLTCCLEFSLSTMLSFKRAEPPHISKHSIIIIIYYTTPISEKQMFLDSKVYSGPTMFHYCLIQYVNKK